MHFYRDAFMFFEKSPLANIVKIWFLLNLLDNRIRCLCFMLGEYWLTVVCGTCYHCCPSGMSWNTVNTIIVCVYNLHLQAVTFQHNIKKHNFFIIAIQ